MPWPAQSVRRPRFFAGKAESFTVAAVGPVADRRLGRLRPRLGPVGPGPWFVTPAPRQEGPGSRDRSPHLWAGRPTSGITNPTPGSAGSRRQVAALTPTIRGFSTGPIGPRRGRSRPMRPCGPKPSPSKRRTRPFSRPRRKPNRRTPWPIGRTTPRSADQPWPIHPTPPRSARPARPTTMLKSTQHRPGKQIQTARRKWDNRQPGSPTCTSARR